MPARQLLGGTSSQLPTTMLAAKDSGASACVRPVHGQGGNFDCVQTSTVNVPKPLPGTAIVRMNVSSVNPSDVDIVEGKFGKLFGTLGADFSGNSSPDWLTLQPCHWPFAGPIPVFSVTLCLKPYVLQGSSLQWVHFAPSFRWAMQYGAPPKVNFPLFPSLCAFRLFPVTHVALAPCLFTTWEQVPSQNMPSLYVSSLQSSVMFHQGMLAHCQKSQ